MRRSATALTIASTLLAVPCEAATLAAETPICLNKADLNPYFVAFLKQDVRALQRMEPRCAFTKRSMQVDIQQKVEGQPVKFKVRDDGTIGFTFHNFVQD